MIRRKFVVASLAVLTLAGYGMSAERASQSAGLSQHNQLKMAVQKICPVSGQQLGDHGTPLLVKVGKEEVFLCCKGCTKRKINPAHWGTIHQNFARAQKICPVMEQELPEKPAWTFAAGQIIYTCCPPCEKKIAANPKKYLDKIDQLYAASLDNGTRQR